MDLIALQTELETIGTVNGLAEVNGELQISITGFIDPLTATFDFINIVNTSIIQHYVNMVTFVNESGSIKVIFRN